ncbi:hypothetical protein ACLOJK_036510 [Asimina triloba]
MAANQQQWVVKYPNHRPHPRLNQEGQKFQRLLMQSSSVGQATGQQEEPIPIRPSTMYARPFKTHGIKQRFHSDSAATQIKQQGSANLFDPTCNKADSSPTVGSQPPIASRLHHAPVTDPTPQPAPFHLTSSRQQIFFGQLPPPSKTHSAST